MVNNTSNHINFKALWCELSPLQRRYVVTRQSHITMKDAAESVGISLRAAYGWRNHVEKAVEML